MQRPPSVLECYGQWRYAAPPPVMGQKCKKGDRFKFRISFPFDIASPVHGCSLHRSPFVVGCHCSIPPENNKFAKYRDYEVDGQKRRLHLEDGLVIAPREGHEAQRRRLEGDLVVQFTICSTCLMTTGNAVALSIVYPEGSRHSFLPLPLQWLQVPQLAGRAPLNLAAATRAAVANVAQLATSDLKYARQWMCLFIAKRACEDNNHALNVLADLHLCDLLNTGVDFLRPDKLNDKKLLRGFIERLSALVDGPNNSVSHFAQPAPTAADSNSASQVVQVELEHAALLSRYPASSPPPGSPKSPDISLLFDQQN